MGVVVDPPTLMRNAVHRRVGLAVRDEGSDLDSGTFAVAPAPGYDCRDFVETHGHGRSRLHQPSGLFCDDLEHLLRLSRRGDECRDAAKRSLLLGEAIRLGLHVIKLARRPTVWPATPRSRVNFISAHVTGCERECTRTPTRG